MSKSTQLVTACYIAAFVGSRYPARVNSDRIAEVVQVHPTRVRRIVSKLVKAGILVSQRGGNGGVVLARDAAEITLGQIHDAVQAGTVLSLGLHDPFADWKDHCFVHATFERLHDELEEKVRADLAGIRLSDVFKPWDGGTRRAPAQAAE